MSNSNSQPQSKVEGEKCFACGKALKGTPNQVKVVGEDTTVFVGPDCLAKIKSAGEYQPPKGGPKLKI